MQKSIYISTSICGPNSTTVIYGNWQTRSVSAKTYTCIRIWKWLDMLSLGRKSGYTIWPTDNDTPQPKNKYCVFWEYQYTLAYTQWAKNSYSTIKSHFVPTPFRSVARTSSICREGRHLCTSFTSPTLTDYHSHDSQMHDGGGSVQLWGGDDNSRIGSKIIRVDCTRIEKTTTELLQSTMCLVHITCHVIMTHWQLESAGEDKYSPATNL